MTGGSAVLPGDLSEELKDLLERTVQLEARFASLVPTREEENIPSTPTADGNVMKSQFGSNVSDEGKHFCATLVAMPEVGELPGSLTHAGRKSGLTSSYECYSACSLPLILPKVKLRLS